MLREAGKNDIKRIAAIHKAELADEFLPRLGQKFLEQLYLDLLRSKFTHTYVYEVKNQVIGFIVGSDDFTYDFKRIILNSFFVYIIILLFQVLKNPFLLINIIETFFYTKKENTASNAELVVIAIDKNFQQQGIGKKLIVALEKDFNKHNIHTYKVTVGAYNKPANKFYKSVGFQKIYTFKLYNKQLNLYLKEL